MADIQARLCDEIRRNLKAGDRPRIPAGGDLLWRWFTDLNATRRRGFFGLEPISWGEIEAYARVCDQLIEPRHVWILHAMDQAFLAAVAAMTPPPGVKIAPRVSDQPLSGALFDAIAGL